MKIYLAGYEGVSLTYDVKLPKNYNVFLTYFYKNNAEKCLEMLQSSRQRLITVDSGAHSFFGYIGQSVSADKARSKMPDPHEYFENYLEWIKKSRCV